MKESEAMTVKAELRSGKRVKGGEGADGNSDTVIDKSFDPVFIFHGVIYLCNSVGRVNSSWTGTFLCVDWGRIDCSLLFISCVLSLGMEWDSGEDRFSWIKEQQRVRT